MSNFRKKYGGFTLVEVLVAMAIFILLMTIVAGALAQIGKIWTQFQSQNLRQQSGRILLDFLARDIENAMLPLETANQKNLQFVINAPSLTADFSNRDNVFFQAPVASDKSAGEIAEVGYFIQWNSSTAQLCRFHINPTSTDYKIYTDPQNWLTTSIVTAAAPATAADNYKGLLAENVVGFWINAFQRDGTPLMTSGETYDSRDAVANGLPASLEISLLVIDPTTSKRLANNPSLIEAVKDAVNSSTNASQCHSRLPDSLRPGANSFVTRVQPRNRQ